MSQVYKATLHEHYGDSFCEIKSENNEKGPVVWRGRVESYDQILIRKGVVDMFKAGCDGVSFGIDDVEEVLIGSEYFKIVLYADSSTAEWFRQECPLNKSTKTNQ